jgi:hypothetical protein
MATVAIYGAGQLGESVAKLLLDQNKYSVLGPYGREDADSALTSGADVVVIATTTLFKDVASYIRKAVQTGSNVLVSSEECAYPWAVDSALATELDELAKNHKVSIAGCGVNPGLIFDALVLTFLGATPKGAEITVRRTVDISKFGATVLQRIGVGWTEAEFIRKVSAGEILGHAGFPQSMTVVADALGLKVERIEKELLPVLTSTPISLPNRFDIEPGYTAGVNQTYTAIVGGKKWFTSYFFGHVDLASLGKVPVDEIEIRVNGNIHQTISLNPGIGAQVGSQNMVANSIDRIIQAHPGWLTLAQLPPAFPTYGKSFARN